MNRVFGDRVIYTTGCGITQIWSGQFQEVGAPRRYLPSGGAGTLGYDIPAAFGAMVATGGNTKAVAVMGDFGFTFHVQELAVAAKNKMPLIVVIINNAYLGLIRQNQNYAYEYEFAVEMSENQKQMDYVKVAEGFACAGARVFTPEDLPAAFERARAPEVPYVGEVIGAPSADCARGADVASIREFQ
jgi:tartronate-semialdehyde synthase